MQSKLLFPLLHHLLEAPTSLLFCKLQLIGKLLPPLTLKKKKKNHTTTHMRLLIPQRAPTYSFSSYNLKGDYNPLIHKNDNVLVYLDNNFEYLHLSFSLFSSSNMLHIYSSTFFFFVLGNSQQFIYSTCCITSQPFQKHIFL